ncbi:hypothetical protein ACIA8E_23750 [Streptomyces sp. NPDC051664]|uniref:hypothetical protein n=1 Tax=Streptomyces sp. NPDC051664 TaxID=3365668 RepID=UPI00379B9620
MATVVAINKAVNTRFNALIAILSYDNVVKFELDDLCPSAVFRQSTVAHGLLAALSVPAGKHEGVRASSWHG